MRGTAPGRCRPERLPRGWLTRDGDELLAELDRLYVPRNDARWLRRNALHALGNVGGEEHLPAALAWVDDEDPVVADAAAWAVAQIRPPHRRSC